MSDAERWSGVQLGPPLTGHTGAVWSVAWAAVGGRLVLAAIGHDDSVWLWDLGDPAAPTPLGPLSAGHPGGVRSVAWADLDGTPVLATGGQDGTVRLWDLGDPSAPAPLGRPLTGHTGPVRSLAWTVLDGRPVLATGGQDGSVQLWDLGQPTDHALLGPPLTGHDDGVSSLAWAAARSGPALAVGCQDGSVQLWDLAEPVAPVTLVRLMTGHTSAVLSLAWAAVDGVHVLTTSSYDGSVRLWDVSVPTAPAPLGRGLPPTSRYDEVPSVAWAVVGGRHIMAASGQDGAVRLWDLHDPAAPAPLGPPLTGHTGPVLSLAWTVLDGRPVLATGSYDRSVRLWEVVEDGSEERLPSYRSDATSRGDELSRADEARALAELVTSRSARPPLAVGLFGDWGEGKSHFLELMQQQVETTARPNNPLAHHAVRQVRFNAWHYAETGLWASLVAELFSQLADAPAQESGTTQRRLSRLTADLVARRELPSRLRAARLRRDQLQEALGHRESRWSRLSEEQRREWEAVAGACGEPGELYEQLLGGGRLLRATVGAEWRLLRTDWRRALGVLVLSVLALVVLSAVALWGPPLWARLVAGLPVLAGAGVLVQKLRRANERAEPFRERFKDVTQKWRDRLQTAADVAQGEVTALERQVQDLTAAGQLAGLVSDRAADSDYRSRLGVMTQIRKDFQRMAELLAGQVDAVGTASRTAGAGAEDGEGTEGTDAVGDRLPAIDRIVIYIDDLDRCPPARVVEMLEAVHLLLAVDLFVVVVAIDPRWLLRSVAAHYRDILHVPVLDAPDDLGAVGVPVDPDDEELWLSTPAQYLEKIFQVVLTLPALDTTGYQNMLRSLLGSRADRNTSRPRSSAAAATDTPAVGTDPRAPSSVLVEPSGQSVRLPAPRVLERVDPLLLDADEIALMELLGPPLLVSTPRAVKRLANSYGLLTALRRARREHDLAEQPAATAAGAPYHPYRAGLVLLAALVAHPQLGPALCLYLYRSSRTDPHGTWNQFLTGLQPRRNPLDGRWSNPADPRMTPVQARQWTSLLTALEQVTDRAAAADLHLPEQLGPWGDWVAPVARLSFPAGRIVTHLDR